ncbi:thioredoxin family protein [Chitinispirillales bacterium ANBcel5]|uniref:thioredoxin family protein n=1 Tax=Cellulosispirillum alkaliphilum TaxID=3039283 RepID=UPI002A515266|nr:thioredoxin family protein [Chitinispirillales bacterium ANBcel5]
MFKTGLLLLPLLLFCCVESPNITDTNSEPQTPTVVELCSETFDQKVNVENRVTMVKFYMNTCPACIVMIDTVEKIAKQYDSENILIGKVNVREESTLSQKFTIRSVPTFIFLRGGEEYERNIGVTKLEKLQELIDLGFGTDQ